jgi:arylformamidase
MSTNADMTAGKPATLDTEIEQGIDALYNLRGHPDRDPTYAQFVVRSEQLRTALARRSQLDIPYASHPRARLDVFHATTPRAVLIFFHGGYWRALEKSIFSFIAAPFVDAGISVVMPQYPLAPEATITDITEHARSAVSWVQSSTLAPLPIIVSGHSAGGHLAAMCALDDKLHANISGMIPISGLFDLVPLCKTNVNVDVRMDEETAGAMSPARLRHDHATPALVMVGGDETDGFKWQTRHYAGVLNAVGARVQVLEAPGLNHFTILNPLADATTKIHREVMSFISHCLATSELTAPPVKMT